MKGKIDAIRSIAKHSEVILINGKEPKRVYEAMVGEEFVGTRIRKVE